MKTYQYIILIIVGILSILCYLIAAIRWLKDCDDDAESKEITDGAFYVGLALTMFLFILKYCMKMINNYVG